MVEMYKRITKQYCDVAIGEKNEEKFAAGLAIGGYKQEEAIYTTFLEGE
ncbi:hypothetical protein HID67_06835 [Pasteurella multocida]|nr:hypothetical protein [Pasteurella multocida]NMR23061.1 hypothetical protein [Pasteurella multocida]